MMRSATTAAWPSANTPAFGVPTLVTSPTAYTSGNDGLERQRVDRDPAVDGKARRLDDRRRPVHGHAEEQVVGHLRAVAEQRDLPSRDRARAPACSGASSMPRSANAASSASDASGDGGIGTRQRHDQRDLGPVAQPSRREEVVHEQRGLARRRRALERRRGDADDHPAAVEVREHVAQRERARHRVELVAALDEARASPPGRGRRRARRRGRRRRTCPASVSTRLAAGSIAVDRRLHEPHAGLDDVGGTDGAPIGRRRAPNMTSSFEKPNTNAVGLVDEHDLDVVAELLRQPRRQLEPAEPRAQHHHPHQRGAYGKKSAVVQREL